MQDIDIVLRVNYIQSQYDSVSYKYKKICIYIVIIMSHQLSKEYFKTVE